VVSLSGEASATDLGRRDLGHDGDPSKDCTISRDLLPRWALSVLSSFGSGSGSSCGSRSDE
jgi:hypothetical protein